MLISKPNNPARQPTPGERRACSPESEARRGCAGRCMKAPSLVQWVWFFWATFAVVAVLPVSAQSGATDALRKRIDDLIARERIDLGNTNAAQNPHQGRITLADIEQVTGAKMKERPSVTTNRAGSVYYWQNPNERAEIAIVYLDSPQKARELAVFMLLSVEDGRTKGGKNLEISNPRIGDLSLRPKKWLFDPHGFDVRDTDKTFCIFARGSTVVGVDSKRNLEPVIPVIDIAKKIDALLAKRENANHQRTGASRSDQQTNRTSSAAGSRR